MKNRRSTFLIATLICFVSLICSAQDPKPSPTPAAQEQSAKAPDDKVYSPKEVDIKAIIKDRNKIDPGMSMGFSSDCPDGVVLVLKAILHKSGKVTDVRVIKPINCSFEEKAIKSVRKIKFTPAIKDGVAVSQYQIFQFNFHKY